MGPGRGGTESGFDSTEYPPAQTEEFDEQKKIVDADVAAKAKHFIPNKLEADTQAIEGLGGDGLVLQDEGLLGFDLEANKRTLFDSGDQRLNTTTVAKVGETVASVFLHPVKTENEYVHEAIERISGCKLSADKLSVASVAEIFAIGKKYLDEGDWDGAYYKLVTALVYSDTEAINFQKKAEHWNTVLGFIQEETVDEIIGRVLADVSSLGNRS